MNPGVTIRAHMQTDQTFLQAFPSSFPSGHSSEGRIITIYYIKFALQIQHTKQSHGNAEVNRAFMNRKASKS